MEGNRIIELDMDYENNLNYNGDINKVYHMIILRVINNENIIRFSYKEEFQSFLNSFGRIIDINTIDNFLRIKIELDNDDKGNIIWELYKFGFKFEFVINNAVSLTDSIVPTNVYIYIDKTKKETKDFIIREKRKYNIRKLLEK